MLSTCLCAVHALANIVLFGRYFHINADFKGQAGTSHTFIDPPVYSLLGTRIKLIFLSHTNKSTQSILPFVCLCSFCFSDGVELTGVESSTVSGSKDKLVNTHAQVTYVFACLPGSFSSPACSIFPSLPLCLLPPPPPTHPPPPHLVFTPFLFSPSVLESKMNFPHAANCYSAAWD